MPIPIFLGPLLFYLEGKLIGVEGRRGKWCQVYFFYKRIGEIGRSRVFGMVINFEYGSGNSKVLSQFSSSPVRERGADGAVPLGRYSHDLGENVDFELPDF